MDAHRLAVLNKLCTDYGKDFPDEVEHMPFDSIEVNPKKMEKNLIAWYSHNRGFSEAIGIQLKTIPGYLNLA